MRYKKIYYFLIFLFVGIVVSSILVTGCVPINNTIRSKQTSQPRKKIVQPSIITLQTKPDWLLLGGSHTIDSRGGDIITIGGKTLQVQGWIFSFENDNPDKNPLVVTPLIGDRIVYWKGKGTITNTTTHEKVVLPLPQSVDPRSDAERAAYFDKHVDRSGN